MLTDPQVGTYSGASKSLARTGSDENESTYRLVDSGNVVYDLVVSHQMPTKAGRNRATVRLTRTALVNDPLASGQSKPSQVTVSTTCDYDALITAADAQALYNMLLTFLTSATFLRVASGET